MFEFVVVVLLTVLICHSMNFSGGMGGGMRYPEMGMHPARMPGPPNMAYRPMMPPQQMPGHMRGGF